MPTAPNAGGSASAAATAPGPASAPTTPAASAAPSASAAPTPATTAGAGDAGQSEGAAPAHPDLVLLAGTAFDGCKAPALPPAPPDGRVASRAQMLASHRQTADFNTATNEYLACLDRAEQNFDRQYGRLLQLNGMQDVAHLENRIHNQALDADHSVADKFNQQLRLYKARGGAT